MKIASSRRRRKIRHLIAAVAGLSAILGGVANAESVSDFFPSFFATQENVSLAVLVDPSVFGIAGAVGFLVLATLRRNRA